MPSAKILSENMQKLGVSKNADIVCYDMQGMFSVARAAWMLRFFGATSVRILEGGGKKWLAEGRQMVGGKQVTFIPSDGDYNFSPVKDSDCILNIKEMHIIAHSLYHNTDGPQQILDARAPPRFNGEVAEPRPGVRSGSIKNSINVPFNILVNEDGTFKSEDDLS